MNFKFALLLALIYNHSQFKTCKKPLDLVYDCAEAALIYPDNDVKKECGCYNCEKSWKQPEMIDFQTAYPMPTRAAGVCISQQECGKNLAIEGCQGKGSASKYGQFDLVLTFKLNWPKLIKNANLSCKVSIDQIPPVMIRIFPLLINYMKGKTKKRTVFLRCSRMSVQFIIRIE